MKQKSVKKYNNKARMYTDLVVTNEGRTEYQWNDVYLCTTWMEHSNATTLTTITTTTTKQWLYKGLTMAKFKKQSNRNICGQLKVTVYLVVHRQSDETCDKRSQINCRLF